MGSLFGKKPKAFSPSKEQKEMERRNLEQGREKESEIAKRRAMAAGKGRGRGSLLSGSETGLKETLG